MATFTEEYGDYISSNSNRTILKMGKLTVGTGEGDTQGDIPASIFGLNKIYSVQLGVNTAGSATDARFFAIPDAPRTSLYLYDLEVATDGDRGAPVTAPTDITFNITVIGE